MIKPSITIKLDVMIGTIILLTCGYHYFGIWGFFAALGWCLVK